MENHILVLNKLHERGINLRLDGIGLAASPAESVTAALAQLIRNNKAALIVHLREQQCKAIARREADKSIPSAARRFCQPCDGEGCSHCDNVGYVDTRPG